MVVTRDDVQEVQICMKNHWSMHLVIKAYYIYINCIYIFVYKLPSAGEKGTQQHIYLLCFVFKSTGL